MTGYTIVSIVKGALGNMTSGLGKIAPHLLLLLTYFTT